MIKRMLIVIVAALNAGGFGLSLWGADVEAPGDWQTEMDAKLSKPLSVDFDGVELPQALAYFRERTRVNIILNMGPSKRTVPRVTLSLHDIQAESALAWTVRLAGFVYVVRDQAIYVTSRGSVDPDERRQMRARYARRLSDQKRGWMRQVNARLRAKIKVMFRNEPIGRAAEQLAQKSGLNIVVDATSAKTAPPVHFQADAMTVENAIRWAARLAGLLHTIRDEVVYIASQREMVKLQLDTGTAAVPARFRQVVSFEFKQTDLMRALKHLQQISGVIIETPTVPVGDYKIELKGENVELNKAVRHVLDLTGLAYAISYRGNIMIVVLQKNKVPR